LVALGVPQSDALTAPIRFVPCPFWRTLLLSLFEPPLLVVGVGHKVVSGPAVLRTRACGRERDCPHGVVQGIQATSHNSDPFSRITRLLSKEDCRSSCLDKLLEIGPEMTLVGEPELLTGTGEWLTWQACRPNRSVVAPSDGA
jgi:hypothetical protein